MSSTCHSDIYPLKSDEYPSICLRNISILATNFCRLGIDLENGGGGGITVTKHNKLFRLTKSVKYRNGRNQAKGSKDISILVKVYLFKSSSDLENEVKITKI